MLDGLKIKAVTIGENGVTSNDLLVHDAFEPNPGVHMMLVNMFPTEGLPVALGVIRSVEDKTYDHNVRDQVEDVRKTSTIRCMDDLLFSGATWEVE